MKQMNGKNVDCNLNFFFMFSPPIRSSSHSMGVSRKVPYPDESSRYRSPRLDNQYTSLHERFSSVVDTNRTEPRIRYTREDLEGTTICVSRDLRDPLPSHRPMGSLDILHRSGEGRRSVFDRDSLKPLPRGVPEEDHYDHKRGGYRSHIDLKNTENYQVIRHSLDGRHDVYPSTSGQSLSDRWSAHDVRKEPMALDRVRTSYLAIHLFIDCF